MATIEQFPQSKDARLSTGYGQTGQQERPYRTPPHNLDAEQALLGAILINNDAFDRVSDFLRSEHFVRGDSSPHFRDRRIADPRRQARDAGHVEDLPRRA